MPRFRDALSGPGLAGIAEIKRRSPSGGDLRPDADPVRLAAAGHAADLREGIALARETLDSGAAATRLGELVEFTRPSPERE